MKHRLSGSMFYLVGPMDEVPDLGADWREDISRFLWNMNIGVMNPCDKPTANGKESPDFIKRINILKKQGQYTEVQKMVEPIVDIDLRMIDLCSAVIMNIDKDYHMCGSYNEQTHACLQRKPIIIHCKHGLDGIPNWLYGIAQPSIFFDSWEKVKAYVDDIAYNILPNIDTLNRWKFFDYNKIYNRSIF